jgi:hypothetical protein
MVEKVVVYWGDKERIRRAKEMREKLKKRGE